MDLVVATLFLHHLDDATLGALLDAVARRADAFFARAPRRAPPVLGASRLVGALGANAVTRRDAVLSVRAGFAGRELAALWPAHATAWTRHEYDAGFGFFSHCLRARRGASPPWRFVLMPSSSDAGRGDQAIERDLAS